MQRNWAIKFSGPIGRKAINSHVEALSGPRCLKVFIHLHISHHWFEILLTTTSTSLLHATSVYYRLYLKMSYCHLKGTDLHWSHYRLNHPMVPSCPPRRKLVTERWAMVVLLGLLGLTSVFSQEKAGEREDLGVNEKRMFQKEGSDVPKSLRR